jgi:hypothetical protein
MIRALAPLQTTTHDFQGTLTSVIFNSSLSSFEARHASSIKAERLAIERVRENCTEIERAAIRPAFAA